jgi:hypothetical protein
VDSELCIVNCKEIMAVPSRLVVILVQRSAAFIVQIPHPGSQDSSDYDVYPPLAFTRSERDVAGKTPFKSEVG